MDLADLTFNHLILALASIIIIWGAVKKINEIITAIVTRHDREKGWDKMRDEMSEERTKMIDRYDKRLTELETKIDENHCQTEAKIQELESSMYMLTKCMSAVLDGLGQLNCNGPVTETKDTLNEFLRKKAYEQL